MAKKSADVWFLFTIFSWTTPYHVLKPLSLLIQCMWFCDSVRVSILVASVYQHYQCRTTYWELPISPSNWLVHHHRNWKSKVSRSIGVINGLKLVVLLERLKTLYCSLVLPYLSYCNIIWGNTFHTNFDKLVVLQKNVVRIITSHPYRSRTNSVFRDLTFLNIVNLNKYPQCLFMNKYLNGLLPHSMPH